MAANRFATILHRNTHKMVFILIYTVLEWILITLLLINAIFSYLIIKFASFFGLHPPCILCARVDHIFEPRKGRKGFYRDLICESHAGELSKLGFCSKHRGLSGTCEDCPASVAEPLDVLECALKDRSVGEDVDVGLEKVEHVISEILPFHLADIEEKKGGGEISLLPFHYFVEDLSAEILVPSLVRIGSEERLLPVDLIDSSTMLACYPRGLEANDVEENEFLVPSLVWRGDEERLLPIDLIDSSTMLACYPRGLEANDKWLRSDAEDKEFAEIGVEEITKNQTSVAVSDYTGESIAFLDWDSHSPLPNSEPCEGVLVHGKSIVLQEDTDVELVTTKIADEFEYQEGFEEQSKVNEEMNCEISIGSDICDQEQIEHAQIHQSIPSPKLLPDEETIDFDQAVTETDMKLSGRRVNHLALPPTLNVELVTTKIADKFESQQGFEEQSKVDEEMNCEVSIGSDACDPEQIGHAQIHQSVPAPKLLPDEETLGFDQAITETDMKLSTRRVNHLALPPVLNEVLEDGMPETPSTPYFIEGFPVLPRKFLLERRESGTESLDGSIASDFDNMEPLTLDRMKAALKAERRSLSALYTELEEERNASAIAANQTMAMITRLQEEKAAMQMEALQYQRMMEEQSEYDQEALQLLNDLMMKREKEKHELEREVDLYREKVLMYEARDRRKKIKGSLSLEDSDDISLESHEGEDNISSPHERNKNTVSADLLSYMEETDTLDGCLTEFEENRLSIFEQIRSLEEKLFKIDGEDEASDTESAKHCRVENGHGGVDRESELLGDGLNDEYTNGSSHDHVTNGKLHFEQRKMGAVGKCLLPLFEAVGSENKSKLGIKYNSVDGSSPELVEEVDQVYQRLQALEADRDFLKHCISSLKKGEKWVNLIQDILQNLHDLRRLNLHDRNSDA